MLQYNLTVAAMIQFNRKITIIVQSDGLKFLGPLPTAGESVAGHMVTPSVIASNGNSCSWSNQPMKFQGSVDAGRNYISSFIGFVLSRLCTELLLSAAVFLQQSCDILTLIMEKAYYLQHIFYPVTSCNSNWRGTAEGE